MSATTSASKGCFVFKGNRKSESTRSPRKRGKQKDVDDSFSEVFGDCDQKSAVHRYEAYRKVWGFMHSKIEAIIANSHSSLLNDITSFVAQNFSGNSATECSSILTAFVTLGVNIPDHATFFSLLETSLHESCTPYVAIVNSKESPSLKVLVERVLQRLMKTPQTNDELEETDVDESEQRPRIRNKSLRALVDWYQNCEKKPVVIVFQDLEAFGQQLLQDFVLLCREYWTLHKLPLVFIMGVATVTVAQQQLHHRTAVCLWARTFQSQPSVTLLNEIVEQLVMDSHPEERVLRLGPRLLRLLLDAFLYHDLSVNSFVQRLHLAVLQHFVALPQAVLCCDASETEKTVASLDKNQLELYRSLPSFMKHVEKDKSRSSAILLIDDDKFRETLHSLLLEIDDHALAFSAHCRVLQSFCSGLPGTIFGKSLREIYCVALMSPLKETEEWAQFVQYMKLSSAPELEERVSNAISALQKVQSKNDAIEASEKLLAELLSSLQNLGTEKPRSATSPTKPKTSLTFQGKKIDRFQLQQQLLASAKQGKKSLSSFEIVRENLVTWISSTLASHLAQPTVLPFHEVFYAGSVTQGSWDIIPFMRRQIQPSPRIAIHRALTNPHFYLRCDCCKDAGDVGCLLPSMPEISVAYKLHTECGRLINLFDWMTAFNSVTITDDSNESCGIDPVTQARFVRAVSELQFLGFVQSSKRKTDHVARLTWGV